MLHARALLVLMAPLLLAIPGISDPASAPAESTRLKCRNSAQKEPLWFLDGRRSADSAFKAIEQDDLEYLHVVCVSVTDSTMLTGGSAAPGIGAISAWTKVGPYRHLKPTLLAVQAAQQAYRARHGAYASEVAALAMSPLPAEVKLTMKSSGDSWHATVSIDRRLSPECRMFRGTPPRATVETDGYVFCS